MASFPSPSLPVLRGTAKCSKGERVFLQLRFGVIKGCHSRFCHQIPSIQWQIVLQSANLRHDLQTLSISLELGDESRSLTFRTLAVYQTWLNAINKCQDWLLDNFYTFHEELGRGGFAVVHRAVHVESQKSFAVKSIPTNELNQRNREYNNGEICVLTTLQHPSLISADEVLYEDIAIHVVMPLMRGGSLSKFIHKHTPISELQLRVIAREILVAVAFLHTNGIVHRDIKMSNMLCEDDQWPPQVKLADFGIAGFRQPHGYYLPNSGRGAPHYSALQDRELRLSGPSSDIWACGCVLYKAIAGSYPFKSFPASRSVELRPPDFETPHWIDLSELGINFIQSLLDLDPDRRPSAANALQHKWMKIEIL